jgi:transcriptional antiterminator RfaH
MKKSWYLAYCRPKEEERAKLHLRNQGIDSYYPLVLTRKIVRGKITEKIEPLFPRYLFVHMNIEEFSPLKVRSTRGIQHIIGHGAKWDEVPTELVLQLMRDEDSDESREIVSKLPKHGQKVIITNGSFKGLQAIYQEPDGNQRAFLLLSLMNSETRACFENSDFTCIST